MQSAPDSYHAFLQCRGGAELFSALQAVQSAGTATEVAQRDMDLHLEAYWKHKDLATTVALAQAGIQFAVTEARLSADAAEALLSAAKGLAYNLASFTWPGWEEPGIVPTREQSALGLQAARFNLRMARELQKPAERVRSGHWLLGAQLLAAGEVEGALGEFRLSIPPEGSPDVGDRPLLEGYVVLARILMGDVRAGEEWEALIAGLRGAGESGAFAREQLVTARRYFERVGEAGGAR